MLRYCEDREEYDRGKNGEPRISRVSVESQKLVIVEKSWAFTGEKNTIIIKSKSIAFRIIVFNVFPIENR